jgi:hypothetical protein
VVRAARSRRTAEDGEIRGLPDGPLLGIDGHGVPFDFAQAPLGMTERERVALGCGWGIRSVSGPRQKQVPPVSLRSRVGMTKFLVGR